MDRHVRVRQHRVLHLGDVEPGYVASGIGFGDRTSVPAAEQRGEGVGERPAVYTLVPHEAGAQL